MSKCIDAKVGKMIGRYEYNKLSNEEREEFENHLLQCNFCFRELYEMSHAVETINGNISVFRKAIAFKKEVFQPVVKKIYSIFPQTLKPAIPLIVVVTTIILAFIISLQFIRPNSHVNITEFEMKNNILKEPEEIENKATIKEYAISDSGYVILSMAELMNKLRQSMQIKYIDDDQNIIFMWAAIKEVEYFQIYLIENNQRKHITYKEVIKDTSFKYPVNNLKPQIINFWELDAIFKTGSKIKVKKKFILEDFNK